MWIRNITNEEFSFEGVKIPPKEKIEVDDLTGQRLLALYWHLKLELVEEKKVEEQNIEKIEEPSQIEELPQEENLEPVAEQPKEEVVEQPKQEEPAEPKGFVCDKCGKVFAKKVGLVAHKRFCKNKYGNN